MPVALCTKRLGTLFAKERLTTTPIFLTMKNLIKTIAIVSALASALTANAIPFSGNINFTGGVTLDSSAGTASQVLTWTSASVLAVDGSFIPFVAAGNSVAISAPWSFNSGAIANFWTVGGFTFDLIGSVITSQTPNSVSVSGSGTLTGHGFDPSVGTWTFTTQD